MNITIKILVASGITTTLTPDTHCPCCRVLLNAASCVTAAAAPTPGDLTVCRCGTLLKFGDGLQVRTLTDGEQLALEQTSDWPKIRELVDLLKSVR